MKILRATPVEAEVLIEESAPQLTLMFRWSGGKPATVAITDTREHVPGVFFRKAVRMAAAAMRDKQERARSRSKQHMLNF